MTVYNPLSDVLSVPQPVHKHHDVLTSLRCAQRSAIFTQTSQCTPLVPPCTTFRYLFTDITVYNPFSAVHNVPLPVHSSQTSRYTPLVPPCSAIRNLFTEITKYSLVPLYSAFGNLFTDSRCTPLVPLYSAFGNLFTDFTMYSPRSAVLSVPRPVHRLHDVLPSFCRTQRSATFSQTSRCTPLVHLYSAFGNLFTENNTSEQATTGLPQSKHRLPLHSTHVPVTVGGIIISKTDG